MSRHWREERTATTARAGLTGVRVGGRTRPRPSHSARHTCCRHRRRDHRARTWLGVSDRQADRGRGRTRAGRAGVRGSAHGALHRPLVLAEPSRVWSALPAVPGSCQRRGSAPLPHAKCVGARGGRAHAGRAGRASSPRSSTSRAAVDAIPARARSSTRARPARDGTRAREPGGEHRAPRWLGAARDPAICEQVHARARYLEETFYPEVRALFEVAERM